MRPVRLALVVALLLVVVVGGPAAAQDEVPDACRTIVGCPDAGPKPENPGDRGGYAQLLTLVALAGGVGFIAIKIGLLVRDGDRRQLTPPSE